MQAGTAKRSVKEIEANLRTLRHVAYSWVIDAVILTGIVVVAGVSALVPIVYLALGLGYVGAVYAATRRGLTERFKDPTLSYPQLLAALLNQCLGLWLAPEVGVFFLLNVFQVFAYGLFTLTHQQFNRLWLATLGLVAVSFIQHGHRISFPTGDTAGQGLLFVMFAACLGRFAWVGGYVSRLRLRVARKHVELTASEARFRTLTNLSSDWYWEQDASLCFTRLDSGNPSGSVPRDLVGKALWESDFHVDGEPGWDELRDVTARREDFRDVVLRRATPNGDVFVSVSGGPRHAPGGAFVGYQGVAKDITNQRLAELRVQHLATHDALTGLPNRAMFQELLRAAVRSAHRYERRFALLYIDLDGFKSVNDGLGHDAGDELLREVSARFGSAVRASDVTVRLGGDEFVVICGEVNDEGDAARVARKLLAEAQRPFALTCGEARVSASIGIALYPVDAQDEEGLVKCADHAMYQAKRAGRGACVRYAASRGQEPGGTSNGSACSLE